ncbi:MAG: PhoH-like ATPase [Flavobacteriales bacterium]|jgi:PhoH-like ATPase
MASKNAKKEKRIYVLDTSVILHDHNSVNHFDEHDVAIPIPVLEELDEFKKGNDTINFEAREFIRFIDKLSTNTLLQDWIPLEGTKGRFKVIMPADHLTVNAEKIYAGNKMDHKILNAALQLKEEEKDATVILITKDMNLRLKARALNLISEDYEAGKIENVDKLSTGIRTIENIDDATLDALFKDHKLDADRFPEFEKGTNENYILKSSKSSALAFYNAEENTIEHVIKQSAYGIKPRNAEQAFALNAILNPNIKVVSLQGVAGTGKTLLALAGSLEQRREFKQIYLARPIVPLSNKDIGYLPGDVKSKITPYMQPLWDNIKFIKNQFNEQDKEYKQLENMVEQEKIVLTPLAYIRGRSLSNVIFIVDEAQNLTPHEVKTIITRAGENTKIIFTGDVRQIDTPYLDEHSNGLSYLIDRVKGHKLFAHIRLESGERSELANLANELL